MTDKAMPRDVNNTPVQTLELGTTTTKIAVAVASASVALPTGCSAGDIVRIACNTDCYFTFGTSSVAADSNDALFITGVEIVQVPKGATHVAAIRVTDDGTMTITEVF
jgi:hypothetical protein